MMPRFQLEAHYSGFCEHTTKKGERLTLALWLAILSLALLTSGKALNPGGEPALAAVTPYVGVATHQEGHKAPEINSYMPGSFRLLDSAIPAVVTSLIACVIFLPPPGR